MKIIVYTPSTAGYTNKMELLMSTTFVELFPYLASITGGLLTLFVGLLLKNQSKTQEYQNEVQKTLTYQSSQLTKVTILLEAVLTDKLPAIQRRLEKLEDKSHG